MLSTRVADQGFLNCDAMTFPSIVGARLDAVGMVDATANSVTFDQANTHGCL